jgi:hypothetical protein
MTGVSHARLHLTRTPRIAHAARRIQGNAKAGRDVAARHIARRELMDTPVHTADPPRCRASSSGTRPIA